MPDREKVKKGLQCIIDGTVRCESCGYAIDKHGHYSCQQECAKDALALLEEQRAKPPRVHENAYGRKFYYCPKCNRAFDCFNQESYCHDCGQEVKWE